MSGGAGPAARLPLSVSWREWLRHDDWCDRGEPRADCRASFDAIVIGSGYGGSVAALRLAEKGWRVLVLERGSEYLTGEFPNDFSLVPKFARLNVPGEGVPIGRATGLLEVHLGQGMVGITGNGLGGGSLVNAGVLMQPDADVFAQPAWPAPIRHARHGGLQPWFARAREALGAQRWDADIPGAGVLRKTEALQRLGEQLGRAAEPVDVTIDTAACLRCGDCASGCNRAGAKRSLDRSYLRRAVEEHHVQVVTQAEVYRFEPWQDPVSKASLGWRVHVFATDAQQGVRATAQVFTEPLPAGTARTLCAPMLFVCAGTFGSTQLLQRSQSLAGGRLPFSPALGTRVSGNGDSLSWLVNEPEPVGGVGQGARSARAWTFVQPAGGDAQAGPPDVRAMVGPTITAAIDLRQRADDDAREPRALPLEQRVVIEDAAIPRAIAQLSRELVATAGTLKQLGGWWFDRPRHPGAADEDPLAASAGAGEHTQTLLAMGHDGSPARLVWLEGLDRSAPYLPQPELLATYQAQQQLFDRFGSRHVHNPLWQPMPAAALDLMSGEKPPRSVLTVHPLGGCVMGDDPATSVVDDRGRVWVHEPGRGCVAADAMEPAGAHRAGAQANEPHVYRGLHVLDGAVVPTSLGCNPLWTITALAERALAAVPARTSSSPARQAERGAARAPEAFVSADVPVAARLNEVLLAREVTLRGALADCLAGTEAAARLEASFDSPDLPRTMQEGRHRMAAKARLSIGAREGPPVDGRREPAEERLCYHGKEGEFRALPAGRWSSGPWPFVRSVLECGALLALPVAVGWGAARGVRSWLVAAPVAPGAVQALLSLVALLAAVTLLGLSVLAALAVLLPFPRTALTWGILRGGREIAEGWREWKRTGRRPPMPLRAMFKQFVHAGEKRVMVYRIPMHLQAADRAVKGAPRTVTLHATKTVMYAASVRELLQWFRARLRAGRSRVPVPLRPTFWEQVMDAHVRVVAGAGGPLAPALLRGVFRMGFENLTSSGLASARRGAKPPIALGLSGDTTSGLLALAAYPLVFLRFALKTRLLDFRLPVYSGVPVPDQAPPRETWLRLPRCSIAPELHWLRVPRGGCGDDGGDDATGPLDLQLWRYRRRDRDGQPIAPRIEHGRWNGRPVARAKSVLLLHAFGQSGLTYTLKTIPRNLAERFHRAGYEVWVLEMRMSTRSGYAGEPCSIDQVAQHDVAGAVRHIVHHIARETHASAPVQIAAFAQCIGAAALWMAALSGELRHAPHAPAAEQDDAPQLSMLSHAMFSQVHPWIVGDRGTQAKTWVPALLQALRRRGTVPFAVRGPQQGLMMPFLDRVLASMPAPAAEGRLYEGHEDAAATCRRIRFIEAPLFRHENLNDATFGAMNLLFGEANLRLFAHARRFVDRERLVDEDGVNRYVTDANLRRHLAFPVQLLHGEANELFDVQGALNSFEALRPTHGPWQEAFCRTLGGKVGPIVVPGHGHLDVLIGRHAARQVFPHIVRFFDACLAERDHVPAGPPERGGWAVRAPRVGPLPGWLREEDGRVLLRLSILVDERNDASSPALPVIRVRYRPPGQKRWCTLKLPDDTWQPMPADPPDPTAPRIGWADLPLEGAARHATKWQVLTLHERHLPNVPLLHDPHVDDARLDDYLAMFQGGSNTLGAVVPPLTLGGHDFGFRGSFFRLPGVALASLPPGRNVSFAAASCRHPGLGLDRDRVDHAAGEFIRSQGLAPVAFGMLLGDQIYADATAGLVDPRSPRERYLERHEQAFEWAGLGRLLARMPFYMTPDDHEWIDAWPAAAPLVKEDWPDWKAGSVFQQRQQAVAKVAQQAVSAFQRLQSPLGGKCGPSYPFQHGCARFFVLDTRLDRKRERPQMVDPKVFAALRDWLRAPQARDSLNVLACGSVVMPALRINADPANPGPEDTWQYAPQQREELLELLVEEAPGRFLLLSGDYHVSGAGLLRDAQGRVLGAAVVAPPLYAPMPYANASPDMVGLDDAALDGGLRFKSVPGGAFLRGSGLGVLHVRRRQAGGFLVSYERSLWAWECGAPQPQARAKLLLP